jgi:hypothetical protein
MHKRTKACAISKKTKEIVYKRDEGCCIFCGAPGLPEAHVVPRSHGGLGVPQNIVTVCRPCHDKMDNSLMRQQMLQEAAEHLKRFYPDWNEKDLIFDKWHKDKAKEQIEKSKPRENQQIVKDFAEKVQKDKEQPPEGFYFLEE